MGYGSFYKGLSICLLTVVSLHCCTGVFLWLQRAGGYFSLWCEGCVVASQGGTGSRCTVVSSHGLRSCGTQASLLGSMWNLSSPGIEPMSLVLQLDS